MRAAYIFVFFLIPPFIYSFPYLAHSYPYNGTASFTSTRMPNGDQYVVLYDPVNTSYFSNIYVPGNYRRNGYFYELQYVLSSNTSAQSLCIPIGNDFEPRGFYPFHNMSMCNELSQVGLYPITMFYNQNFTAAIETGTGSYVMVNDSAGAQYAIFDESNFTSQIYCGKNLATTVDIGTLWYSANYTFLSTPANALACTSMTTQIFYTNLVLPMSAVSISQYFLAPISQCNCTLDTLLMVTVYRDMQFAAGLYLN